MNAQVKLKDIAVALTVEEVNSITMVNSRSGSRTEITDFKSLNIYPNHNYIFVGNSILHVPGTNIEFVMFY